MTDRRELDPAIASDRLMGATARAVRGVLRLYRLSVLGRASFPASGPVVLVANHSGVLDGPLVAAVLDTHSDRNRALDRLLDDMTRAQPAA